jgi:signal transduction histidine kinase
MATEALFTNEALRHVASMARDLRPSAARLERDCRALLKRRGYDSIPKSALLAIAPVAIARVKSIHCFLDRVESQGHLLAKHNISPGEVKAALHEMEALLDDVLGGRFGPSREQVHLATVIALDRAFYLVREAEAQALFGLYRAEVEARDADDLLRRVAAVLTRAFGAGAGQVTAGAALDRRLMRFLNIQRGTPRERLVADGPMRRRYRCFWSHPLGDAAVIQLGFVDSREWLPRERTLLEIAAERCRGALERARLQKEVRRLDCEARQAEEEERRRIGRELHDETGQALLLLRLQLEMIEREANATLAVRLKEARSGVERTVVELRRLIAALSPTVLDRLGLAAALRHLVTRFRKSYPADVKLRLGRRLDGLPRQAQDAIYRAAQECLQNIARHSQASTVKVSLSAADHMIRLRVTDNGAGFQRDDGAARAMSFGLEAMRDRAALVGGRAMVRSAPRKGTSVVVEVPRTEAMVKKNVKNSSTVD